MTLGNLQKTRCTQRTRAQNQWRSQGLPGWGRQLHPEGQTEDKNEEFLRKNKKK